MKTYLFEESEYSYQIVQFNPGQPYAIYGDSLIGELEKFPEGWRQTSGSKLPTAIIKSIALLLTA